MLINAIDVANELCHVRKYKNYYRLDNESRIDFNDMFILFLLFFLIAML